MSKSKKVESCTLCMGAMGYWPSLWVDHTNKVAYFSNPGLESWKDEDAIDQQVADQYATKFDYETGVQILALLRKANFD